MDPKNGMNREKAPESFIGGCAAADGSYPFDNGNWSHLLQINEEIARNLLGGLRVCNKEFRVIERWDGDYQYTDWDESKGRERERMFERDYYPGAVAVYLHDFTYWLIKHK